MIGSSNLRLFSLPHKKKARKKAGNQTFAFDGSMVASLANRERIINKVD